MTKTKLINDLIVHRIKLHIIIVVLLIGIPTVAFSQLKQYGPGRKAADKTVVSENARRNPESPVSLPFWDDFSFADGQLANPLLWIVNDKVFINDGQAINPPSINVATFDGYNENGIPYSTEPLATGVADTLESQRILLADFPAQYQDSTYLTFTYQAGGNSEMPNPDDYLLLEFKSANKGVDGWVEVKKIRVNPNIEPDKFYDVVIQITPQLDANDTIYFHNDFQFRFTSLGRISGAYDAWHLDYVYLNRRISNDTRPITQQINEFDINTNIGDRTTTKPFTTIFPKGYYAMPVGHFNPAEMIAPSVSMYSLRHVTFDNGQTVSYEANYKITNYTGPTGVTTFDFDDTVLYNGLPDDGDFIPNDGIPLLQHITAQTKGIPNVPSYFDSDADSTKVEVEITIDGGDNDADYYSSLYVDIDFELNDKLEHTFTLSNYYAYDDGVAEYSAGLAAQGNQLAYRFVMDNSVGAKSLKGIDIYLPFTASSVPQNMRVYVFRDDAGKPDSMFTYSAFVPVTRTSNNNFYSIEFEEDVIVRDTFYIGYLETVTDRPDRIRVGLDASHDTGEHMYYRNTVYHQWVQNNEVKGSLMMRPIFGTVDPVTGIEDPRSPVSIYPNPNRGEFYMKGSFNSLQIITMTGQSATFTAENQDDLTKISLNNTTPGLYIVRYRSGSKIFTDKILVKDY